MRCTEIHDDKYLKVLWDGESRIIAIDWKESIAGMTDDDFKAELMSFAGHVESPRAESSPMWAISATRWGRAFRRDFAAGVRRFASLFPSGGNVPPTMNESAAGENFVPPSGKTHQHEGFSFLLLQKRKNC